MATVLVLEENSAVQELLEQALRDARHNVLSTDNSLEALRVVRRIEVDLIVIGEVIHDRRSTLLGEFREIQPDVSILDIDESAPVRLHELLDQIASTE